MIKLLWYSVQCVRVSVCNNFHWTGQVRTEGNVKVADKKTVNDAALRTSAASKQLFKWLVSGFFLVNLFSIIFKAASRTAAIYVSRLRKFIKTLFRYVIIRSFIFNKIFKTLFSLCARYFRNKILLFKCFNDFFMRLKTLEIWYFETDNKFLKNNFINQYLHVLSCRKLDKIYLLLYGN